MMNFSLNQLAPHSRVWIFQSDKSLSPSDVKVVHDEMQNFLPKWAAHGNELYGGYGLEKGLFLVVGVDESKSSASGCSIDALTHTIKKIGAQINVDFFNRLAIAYENNGLIELTDMNSFKAMLRNEKVDKNTIVYNNLVNTKKEFDNQWRTAVQNSWHANLIELV